MRQRFLVPSVIFKNKKSLKKHKKLFCQEREKALVKKNTKKTLVDYENDSDDSEEEVKNVIKCKKCPKEFNSSRGLRKHKAKFHKEKASCSGVAGEIIAVAVAGVDSVESNLEPGDFVFDMDD